MVLLEDKKTLGFAWERPQTRGSAGLQEKEVFAGESKGEGPPLRHSGRPSSRVEDRDALTTRAGLPTWSPVLWDIHWVGKEVAQQGKPSFEVSEMHRSRTGFVPLLWGPTCIVFPWMGPRRWS